EQGPSEVCKITDNFNWYLAAVIDVEDAKNVKVGNNVTIKIDNSNSDEVSGTVYYISEAQDGKNVMILQSNLFVEGISSVRSVDYQVILQKKTGLKIPSAALRIENGKKGVYILIDKKKSFRYVNDNPFRSEDDQYYIVNQKYTPAGAPVDYVPLKEYDKVLLNPEDVR
ncbi:MAG: HlyD family efflux transporter periplasmic adaptor subunit, partial [Clostridia bacterium]